MTTIITINGQISGNNRLLRAITTIDSKSESTGFNNYRVIFPTKAAAKKALSEAFKYLRSEEPEFAKGGISYSKYGSLSYDASRAEIKDNY